MKETQPHFLVPLSPDQNNVVYLDLADEQKCKQLKPVLLFLGAEQLLSIYLALWRFETGSR